LDSRVERRQAEGQRGSRRWSVIAESVWQWSGYRWTRQRIVYRNTVMKSDKPHVRGSLFSRAFQAEVQVRIFSMVLAALCIIPCGCISVGSGNSGLVGSWIAHHEYQGHVYDHDMVITQQAQTGITGSGGYPTGGPYSQKWRIVNVVVTGNNVMFTVEYTAGATGTTMHMTGHIGQNGSIRGTWDDNYGGSRHGTWSAEKR